MPGARDRNLRSGDLHEELGLFLLRSIALVAPVPRQEDVGNDAFATLIRPEGSRRLIPDMSFLVQLKAASISEVNYSGPDEVGWITNLEIPLFIGRVDLKQASISLFSTQRVHQILMENAYDEIRLLLDPSDEWSRANNARPVNIGPPVHTWSVTDVGQQDFMAKAFSILRPHVEYLRRNRLLRDLRYQHLMKWETGKPPEDQGIMMMGIANDDSKPVLESMIPNVRRLLSEIAHKKRYRDFPILIALIDMMRRWGVDPDPDGTHQRVTASDGDGPEISDAEVIAYCYSAYLNALDLSRLRLSDASLAAIPEQVTNLALTDVPITDDGIKHLFRLRQLSRLGLGGTNVTDVGLALLASLNSLEWINLERTKVTNEGIGLLKAELPNIEVIR
jgi:hypothetical protein